MAKMHKFDKRISNIPNKIWEKIAEIDELKGSWIGGANLNPQALGRHIRSIGGGRNDDSAASHQELVYGVDGFLG